MVPITTPVNGFIEIRRAFMIPPDKYLKFAVSVLIIAGFVAASNVAVFAKNDQIAKPYGVAIRGYDPVAYFTESMAVQGSSEYSHTWNEASWYFSTPEHRDLFAANPEKYAPKHGGF
jgi:YHS domain-containing protein